LGASVEKPRLLQDEADQARRAYAERRTGKCQAGKAGQGAHAAEKENSLIQFKIEHVGNEF
jgi:hypothetical protein